MCTALCGNFINILGTLLYQMGEVDEGEKYLRYALKLNPNHHGALNNLKVIQYYRNKKH